MRKKIPGIFCLYISYDWEFLYFGFDLEKKNTRMPDYSYRFVLNNGDVNKS